MVGRCGSLVHHCAVSICSLIRKFAQECLDLYVCLLTFRSVYLFDGWEQGRRIVPLPENPLQIERPHQEKKAFLVPPKLILPIQHHLQKLSSLSMNWGTLSEMDGDPYSQLKEDGFMVLDPLKKLATCWKHSFGNPEPFVSFS